MKPKLFAKCTLQCGSFKIICPFFILCTSSKIQIVISLSDIWFWMIKIHIRQTFIAQDQIQSTHLLNSYLKYCNLYMTGTTQRGCLFIFIYSFCHLNCLNLLCYYVIHVKANFYRLYVDREWIDQSLSIMNYQFLSIITVLPSLFCFNVQANTSTILTVPPSQFSGQFHLVFRAITEGPSTVDITIQSMGEVQIADQSGSTTIPACLTEWCYDGVVDNDVQSMDDRFSFDPGQYQITATVNTQGGAQVLLVSHSVHVFLKRMELNIFYKMLFKKNIFLHKISSLQNVCVKFQFHKYKILFSAKFYTQNIQNTRLIWDILYEWRWHHTCKSTFSIVFLSLHVGTYVEEYEFILYKYWIYVNLDSEVHHNMN